jgi:hypothetical protein
VGAAALPIAVGAQVGGGLFSAYQQTQQGKIQQGYYDYLASGARANAGLAEAGITANREAIGTAEADAQRRLTNNVNATMASQKAALAAGGAGVGSRTGQDLIANTENQGNLDEQALRLNADMKAKAATVSGETAAFGYETQAAGDELTGSNIRSASNIQAESTILGTAGSVASSWYKMPTSNNLGNS